ncbi:MAG: porin family protein [Muribaculaceae bacterium]|nr:porin family protein [Muribaculaceae bacterium]
MKSIKAILTAALLVVACALPASAQFRFGVRLGTEVNSMRLNKDVFDNDNRAGFTGGLMTEFTVPVVNLGFDLSVMYVHRVSASTADANASADIKDMLSSDKFRKRDYIEIPLNLKYKLALPAISRIVAPYVTTGPSFSILASKKAINNAFENKAFDVAWNFGLGVQLINHLQVGASYGIGLNKTVKALTNIDATAIDGKNNYWTITAAWLF